MRVDEQVVERESLRQVLEAVVQSVDVIALFENAGDFSGLDARGDEEHAAGRGDNRCALDVDDCGGHVDRRLFDTAAVPQIIVQGQLEFLRIDPEQNVNSEGLYVG